MTQAALDSCQDLIEYRFKDPELLSLALTHSSVATSKFHSNERLEFLGDAVLGAIVCSLLYKSHADLLEGDMTKVKSLVVSREVCADIASEIGISDMLFLSKGMTNQKDLPSSVAAAVFESIIGAIYLDGGLEAAEAFVLTHIGPCVAAAVNDGHKRNFKSILQQYAQRRWRTTPEYRFLDEQGPDHSKCFEIAVVLNGKNFPSAWGMTKKQAEQEAAKRALITLGHINDEEENEDTPNTD